MALVIDAKILPRARPPSVAGGFRVLTTLAWMVPGAAGGLPASLF